MRRVCAALLVLLTWHIHAQPDRHLRVAGTRFRRPGGAVFPWRGISAFRLVEFVAHGREADADAYLAWAASKRLTIVRVLAMADGIFDLPVADGLRALPRLLELAARRRLHVEVVALTGTAAVVVDAAAQVKAVGAVCARFPNAVLELANEPGHPTQSPQVHDAAYLASLAALVPPQVPVALGSVEYGDGFAAGTYVTWHAPRSASWPAELAGGAAMVRRFNKPVISDEPMGAGDEAIPGRRDNQPAHFSEAAVVSRRAGIGATFHYDGGVQARLPTRTETACLDAWLAAMGVR